MPGITVKKDGEFKSLICFSRSLKKKIKSNNVY